MEAHRREGGGCGKVFSLGGISPGANPRKSPSVRALVRAVDRPCIRPSVSPVGRSRSSRSRVEAWPSSSAWPSQIALVISTDTEDANGEIEGGTTSPPHLSRRAVAVVGQSVTFEDAGTARRTDYAPRIVEKPPYSPYERVQQDGRRIYGRSLRRVLRRSTRRFGRGGGVALVSVASAGLKPLEPRNISGANGSGTARRRRKRTNPL